MTRSNDGLLALFLVLLVILIAAGALYLYVGTREHDTPRTTVTYIPMPSQTLEVPSAYERALSENRALQNRVTSLERERASLQSSLEASRLEAQRFRSNDDRFRFRFDNDCDDDCEDEIEDLEDEIEDLEDTIDELCEELDDEDIDSDECD